MPEEPKSVLMHPQAAGGPIMAAPAEGEEDEDGVFGWFSQQQLDNVDIEEQDCPLFMDEEQLKDPKNAAQLEWLSSCTYEGMDGKEIALELKEKGNLVLKGDPVQAGAAKTRPNPKLAITMYDDALYQEHDDTVLKAVLWNNRAMANLKLKNWGHVMTDCVKSIRLNKTLKAYWRGAQASLKLKKFAPCKEFCKEGLKLEPEDKELLAIAAKAEKEQAEAEAEAAVREKAEKRALRAEKMLLATVKSRGVRMGTRPEWLENTYHLDLRNTEMVYLDEEDSLHWAMCFLYPEHATSDLVQDMHEDCALGEQLSQMFPPAVAPPSWDVDRKYDTPELVICYEASADPSGEKPNKRFSKLPLECTLKEALARTDFVVPGYPTFHVVVKGSPFANQYLDDNFIRVSSGGL